MSYLKRYGARRVPQAEPIPGAGQVPTSAGGHAWAVDDWGTTEAEELAGESLDGRLRRELPDRSDDEGDGLGDLSDSDGELLDDEVGDARAGRLVDAGDGGTGDTDDEMWARDAGIDGAAASAEEAAVHVVRDPRD